MGKKEYNKMRPSKLGKNLTKRKVRAAIIGVGNCASALVQGVHFYQNAPEDQFIPGLMNPVLGGYHIRDIEFSAAIDIAKQILAEYIST